MRREHRSKLFATLGVAVVLSPLVLEAQTTVGAVTSPPEAQVNVSGSIAFDTPQLLTSTVAGQVFNLAFSGEARQMVSLAEVNNASPCAIVSLSILKPDHRTFAATSPCGSSSINNLILPATGTYTVRVSPGTASGGITLCLTHNNTMPITLDSPETASSPLPGQGFSLTFEGSIGQRVNLAATNSTYPCGAMGFKLLKPDGKTLASAEHVCGNSTLSNERLPLAGTYTVLVNPGWASGGATFVLSSPGK